MVDDAHRSLSNLESENPAERADASCDRSQDAAQIIFDLIGDRPPASSHGLRKPILDPIEDSRKPSKRTVTRNGICVRNKDGL
jgi:hypothetical protein